MMHAASSRCPEGSKCVRLRCWSAELGMVLLDGGDELAPGAFLVHGNFGLRSAAELEEPFTAHRLAYVGPLLRPEVVQVEHRVERARADRRPQPIRSGKVPVDQNHTHLA